VADALDRQQQRSPPVHAGGFLPRIVSIFDCGHAERVKGMVRPGACRSPLTARRAADRLIAHESPPVDALAGLPTSQVINRALTNQW